MMSILIGLVGFGGLLAVLIRALSEAPLYHPAPTKRRA